MTKCDRMMCYLWEDTDSKLTEIKFGDHWVHNSTWQEAVEDVTKYVRGTLARQKYKYDQGRVILHKIWDASEYARYVNKFYPHSKLDDHIRKLALMHRLGGDVHEMDVDDAIIRVNQELAKIHHTLPPARLSTMQTVMAQQVCDHFDAGTQVILAELCARFGKTIWSGAVAHELQAELVVVASYVKTVFASFAKDLTSFEQWSTYCHVDTQAADWQAQVQSALTKGQKVIAYLSMAPGSKRNARISWLFDQPVETMLILDEADFGSHTQNQALPLKQVIKPEHRVLIMTGTNSDRASKFWNVQRMVSVTYPELLVQKTHSVQALAANAPAVTQNYLISFETDIQRDVLMPSLSMYQLDLSVPVAQSVAQGEFDDPEMKLLPSWSKFAAHPVKSKGFFVRILETVFLGKHQVEAANVDLQTLNWFGRDKHKVTMMFLPHQTGVNSGALKAAGAIAAQALPAWRVITLGGGDIRVGNMRVKNANAERVVREQIDQAAKQNQSVLILASQMAQRSFSIPEITELYLAYDAGQAGATIQKMSRVLTPGSDPNKVGKIISLSFDPNRDDKFDVMLLETAQNIHKRQPDRDPHDIMAEVLSTMDIWKGGAHSGVKVIKDEFLQEALSRKSISKVLGSIADLGKWDPAKIRELAQGVVQYSRVNPVAATPKGKVKNLLPKPKPKLGQKNVDAKLQQQARERIVAVAENTDMLISLSGQTTIRAALEVISQDAELCEDIQNEFGVRWDLIRDLYEDQVINPFILSLMKGR